MTESEMGQLETTILNAYIPGLSKEHRKALRKLCKEKGVKLFNDELQSALTRLLASIIRHRETEYESICAAVGKERARFYVQPIVSECRRKE